MLLCSIVGSANNPLRQRTLKRVWCGVMCSLSPTASRSLVRESLNSSAEASKAHWIHLVNYRLRRWRRGGGGYLCVSCASRSTIYNASRGGFMREASFAHNKAIVDATINRSFFLPSGGPNSGDDEERDNMVLQGVYDSAHRWFNGDSIVPVDGRGGVQIVSFIVFLCRGTARVCA